MPTSIVYTPFFTLESEKEYQDLIKKTLPKSADSTVITYSGLPFMYSAIAKSSSWEKYTQHVKELALWKKGHMLNLIAKGYEVIDLNCPAKGTRKKQILSPYHSDNIDSILIHCHGNTEVLGTTGGFYLPPDLLAQHFEILGLSKNHPPTLVVWACKSGVGDKGFNEKTYADRLYTAFKSNKYGNLSVVGIKASIVNTMESDDPKKLTVSYKLEDKIVDEKKVLQILLSPEKKKKHESESFYQEGGVFTQIRKLKPLHPKLDDGISLRNKPKPIPFSLKENYSKNEITEEEPKKITRSQQLPTPEKLKEISTHRNHSYVKPTESSQHRKIDIQKQYQKTKLDKDKENMQITFDKKRPMWKR